MKIISLTYTYQYNIIYHTTLTYCEQYIAIFHWLNPTYYLSKAETVHKTYCWQLYPTLLLVVFSKLFFSNKVSIHYSKQFCNYICITKCTFLQIKRKIQN